MIGAPSFGGGGTDLNSSEGLLNLADQQGGQVAQTANELAHPTTGILSTIGNGIKNAFKDFVDVLSVPSEVVAGALSPTYSISEAIKKNIKPSDVIFGQQDKNASTMQKVGGFLTRTATDILLDPLTYVTFGAGSGAILGARGATEIALGEKAAANMGLEASASAAVSSEGQNLYSMLSKVNAQAKGLMKADELSGTTLIAQDIAKKTGLSAADSMDFTKNELKEVLSQTIDKPLDPDFAKKAMSSLMEKFPQLTETLLDKGGVKIFGQSILSGQRIRAGVGMIPGMTVLDHITAPARKSIQALFDPAMVKLADGTWQRLPDEYVHLEQAAKDLATSMGDSRINKLHDVVRANDLSSSEAELLLVSVESRKLPADARLANAYKQLMGFNKEEFEGLRMAGIPVTFLDKHVPHMLVQGTAKMMPFSMPPAVKVGAALKRTLEGTIYSADSGKLEALEGAVLGKDTVRVNKMLGDMKNDGFDIFDPNIVTAMARRSVDNTKAIVTKNFLDALPKHFATTADMAPEGWVPLNLSQFKEEEEFLQKVGQSANALRFHPAIAKRVENFLGAVVNDDATKDAFKTFDSIQNFWKASVTSVFPSFHGRNAISNVFMHFNDLGVQSFNPAMHAISGQLVAADRKLSSLVLESMKVAPREGVQDEISELLGKKVFTDATGNDWSFGELQRVMKNNNIAFNKNIVGSMDTSNGTKDLIADLFPSSSKDIKGFLKRQTSNGMQNFTPFVVGRDVGRAIEEQARTMDFITNLKRTGDVSMAAVRTKQFLFDYQNLTAFEKTFLRRVMPFYTFTRKNLEMQARTLLSAPGYSAAQLTALTNLGDAISGGKLTPEQEAALPDWIKSGIAITKKQEGNIVELYGSLGTPLEAAFSTIQPNNVLGSLSPILRVPVELGSGYNFFQGKPISEVTNASAFKNAPQPIKDLIGYTEVTGKNSNGQKYQLSMSLRPAMMDLIMNLPPTTRVLTTLKQVQDANVDNGSKILQQLVGVRPYSFDLVQEQQKRENELKAKLTNLLTTAGVTAQYTRTYKPKPN